MSTQLRLVDTPSAAEQAPAPRVKRRARATTASRTPSRGRRVHWDADWRLSDQRRRIGLEGVAAARAALERHRPDADEQLAS